jgi:predicted lipid-binding transport protein (Tim44 family)
MNWAAKLLNLDGAIITAFMGTLLLIQSSGDIMVLQSGISHFLSFLRVSEIIQLSISELFLPFDPYLSPC